MDSGEEIKRIMSRNSLYKEIMCSKNNKTAMNKFVRKINLFTSKTSSEKPLPHIWKMRMIEREKRQKERAATRSLFTNNFIPVDIKSTVKMCEAYDVKDSIVDIEEKVELDLLEFGNKYQTVSTVDRYEALTELSSQFKSRDSMDNTVISSRPTEKEWKQRMAKRDALWLERKAMKCQHLQTTLEDIDGLRKIAGTYKRPSGVGKVNEIEKQIENQTRKFGKKYEKAVKKGTRYDVLEELLERRTGTAVQQI